MSRQPFLGWQSQSVLCPFYRLHFTTVPPSEENLAQSAPTEQGKIVVDLQGDRHESAMFEKG